MLKLFKKLKGGLSKTRQRLTDGLANVTLGKKQLDDELLEELETTLLSADMGLSVTQNLLDQLVDKLGRKALDDPNIIFNTLKAIMCEHLLEAEQPLQIDTQKKPYTLMMVGINGSGKTTTLGKLAYKLHKEGFSVAMSAGDTFRAAAIEQLQSWGERYNIPVIAQHSGSDSAAVTYDALQSSKAKQTHILLADTAGRLHTQSNLMEELKKIKRVMAKLDPNTPHETMLVIDASIGQNALQQARMFNEAVGIDSLCITKLDGTAKGGIVFAIVQELGLPIRYIGVGETVDDLQPFVAEDFVEALFADPYKE